MWLSHISTDLSNGENVRSNDKSFMGLGIGHQGPLPNQHTPHANFNVPHRLDVVGHVMHCIGLFEQSGTLPA